MLGHFYKEICRILWERYMYMYYKYKQTWFKMVTITHWIPALPTWISESFCARWQYIVLIALFCFAVMIFFFIFFFREISLDRFWHISQLINVFRFSSLSDLVMLWSLIVCSFLSILLLCLFCMITFNITLEMILIMFWMNLGLFDGWNRTEILLGYWLIVPIFRLLILYSFVLLW